MFGAGSLVGALAPNSGTLIAGRVVMGVGAAACEPGTLSLIRQIYPDARDRARALGVWTGVSGVSLAAGPVLGGVLVGAAGWRGIFWFNLAFGRRVVRGGGLDARGERRPCGPLARPAGARHRRGGDHGAHLRRDRGRRAPASAPGGSSRCSSSPRRAGAAFVWIELRARDPVLRLEFFRNRVFASATAVAFATSFGLFAVFFFTALYLQIVSHFSGWKIALQFVAMAVAMVVAGRVAGVWTGTRGPRLPMCGGCLLAGGGMLGVNALLAPDVSVGPLAAALAVVGFGLGLALVAVTAAVLSIVPAERSGMAASTINTSRQLGGVLAVAILGAVVNHRLVGELSSKLGDLGVPSIFRSLVLNAVTHGGLPANAQAAEASNPIAASHPGLLAKVLTAAQTAFGHGLHVALERDRRAPARERRRSRSPRPAGEPSRTGS